MAADTTKALEWDYEELRRAVESAGVALWSWNIDNDALAMDLRGYELWNVPLGEDLTFEHLSEKIHPSDRDRVREAFSATRGVVGAYEIDFRTLIEEQIRWISARGQGGDVEAVQRTNSGIFLDITGRKQAEESSELLAGEMSHRVKNLLAMASALTSMTSRSSKSVEDMSKQLTQRLSALGRAHDFVRPLPASQGKAALLGDLFSVLLSPYDDDTAFGGRIRVAVPRMGIGERAASCLALVVHELATNSVKYGALSAEGGTLDISGTQNGTDVQIVWVEQGGPAITQPENAAGYGTRLVHQTMQFQLGGSVDYDWSGTGLVVTLVINGAFLSK